MTAPIDEARLRGLAEAAWTDDEIFAAIEASTFALQDSYGKSRGALCISVPKFRAALSKSNPLQGA